MPAAMDVNELRAKIRDIKDFPTEGILFKDITTLLKDGPAWASVIDHLAARYHTARVDLVVGVESRGFIFGGALAHQLKAGFVPVRKRGKLPAPTIEEEYELEYGRDVLAIHEDAVRQGAAGAGGGRPPRHRRDHGRDVKLLGRLGATVVGAAFLIELAFLKGRGAAPGPTGSTP